MSPGRASAALTTWRPSWWASACWTQVETAAQPLPGILWPACAIDQVTKLAHHGLPGPTPAAARYLSTSTPVLTPVSWTPLASSPWANPSAEDPRSLEPPPPAAAAVASTAAGTVAGSASMCAGPDGALRPPTARKLAVCRPAAAALAFGSTDRNDAVWPLLTGPSITGAAAGAGGTAAGAMPGVAAAAEATGAPGATGATGATGA